ncbi:MAG: PDZ domain-containing protein, partial [Planctomycetes bacterium]|nr:PDZ domain-containing protein [Planctomycetota bacterium]
MMKSQQFDQCRRRFGANLCFVLAVLLVAAANTVQGQSLKGSQFKNGSSVRNAFRKVVAKANRSTVAIYSRGKQIALGTIVGSNGLILTKASELKGRIKCKLHNGRTYNAVIVGIQDEYDLALLRIKARSLQAIQWRKKSDPLIGSWLITPGLDAAPVSVGVLSVGRRRIPKPRPLLGVRIDDKYKAAGARILTVTNNSGAAKAGLKKGDIITWLAGVTIKDFAALSSTIRKHRVGETVELRVKRNDAELKFKATFGALGSNPSSRGYIQNHMGGSLSRRKAGFPVVLQHDGYLRPQDCGGPVVDLQGRAVGINIARAGRTESYTIPADRILALLPNLKSGKLA